MYHRARIFTPACSAMTFRKPPSDPDRFGLGGGVAGHVHKLGSTDGRKALIRNLHGRHRARILAHLLQLDERDRYLRFGAAVSTGLLEQYVAKLDFKRDKVFGVFDRHLRLIGVAHLALLPAAREQDKHMDARVMEFGVSVLAEGRGHGLGMQLFQHAIMHARNQHATHLMIHALSENAPMLRIAAKAGATIERHGPDTEAWLRLPPDTVGSHLDSSWQALTAELNYGVRHRLLTLNGKLRTLLTAA